MTHGKEGWETEIIETGTKKKVIDWKTRRCPETKRGSITRCEHNSQ